MNRSVHTSHFLVHFLEAVGGHVITLRMAPHVGQRVTEKMAKDMRLNRPGATTSTCGLLVYQDVDRAIRMAQRVETWIFNHEKADGA